ncbi:uncharacterized protein V1518DRAFT_435987 [Limtongia smithiae]|uniref:uncharacterized protein n=1 Tax=Limtongia smithiae TaxID=1125753 RepID=UPI0034CD82E1
MMSWPELLQDAFAAVIPVLDTANSSATQLAKVLVRVFGGVLSGAGVGALPVAKTGLSAVDYYTLHYDGEPDTEVVDAEVSAHIWSQSASASEGDTQLISARMKRRLGYRDDGSFEFPAPWTKSLRSMLQLSQAAAKRNGRTSTSHMLRATLIDEVLRSTQIDSVFVQYAVAYISVLCAGDFVPLYVPSDLDFRATTLFSSLAQYIHFPAQMFLCLAYFFRFKEIEESDKRVWSAVFDRGPINVPQIVIIKSGLAESQGKAKRRLTSYNLTSDELLRTRFNEWKGYIERGQTRQLVDAVTSSDYAELKESIVLHLQRED